MTITPSTWRPDRDRWQTDTTQAILTDCARALRGTAFDRVTAVDIALDQLRLVYRQEWDQPIPPVTIPTGGTRHVVVHD